MFVDDRQTRFARVLPAFLIILTAGGGTDGADDDDVRICGFDGVENLLEAVFEHVVDEILVADAEVFEAERLRVTHGGALGAPFGGGAAVAEFDEVEYFIDVSGISSCATGTGPWLVFWQLTPAGSTGSGLAPIVSHRHRYS